LGVGHGQVTFFSSILQYSGWKEFVCTKINLGLLSVACLCEVMSSERMNESCDSKVGVTGRLLKAEYKRLSLEQEQARLLEDSQLCPISACLSHCLNDFFLFLSQIP